MGQSKYRFETNIYPGPFFGTLKNWQQGRRDPTGPAKALLQVIRKDPAHVLKALAGGD